MRWFQSRKQFAGGHFFYALICLFLIITPSAGSDVNTDATSDVTLLQIQQDSPKQIRCSGSSTILTLMDQWTKEFRQLHANIDIIAHGAGSNDAVAAMLNGTTDIGMLSRPLTADESARLVDSLGYEPLTLVVALDAITIFVHQDNPISELTLPQIDAIFSTTQYLGRPSPIVSWSELPPDSIANWQPISIYGRTNLSGTHTLFQQIALQDGDYNRTIQTMATSADVVRRIVDNPFAIGYAGIGDRMLGVKAVSLAQSEGKRPFEPTYENVLRGDYPLGRALYLCIAAPNLDFAL